MRVVLASILAGLFTSLVYAQTNQTESLSIVTYYPAPYGVYRQLNVHRSVIFSPQNNIPGLVNPKPGEMVYNGSDDRFYHYNGTQWVPNSGAGVSGIVLTLSCAWGSDFRNSTVAVSGGWGNQCGPDGLNCCVPAACPSGWTDIGTEPKLTSVACPGSRECKWNNDGTSDSESHPAAGGKVVRTCVKYSGGTVITRSCPWGSDGFTAGANKGWGNQCDMSTDNCCVTPACPAGWTSVGKHAEVTGVACPGASFWATRARTTCSWEPGPPVPPNFENVSIHPVAVGRVVRTCVQD